jgi:GAF domain-containing protein
MSYWLDLLYLRHNVLTILSKPSTLAMSPVNVYSSCADLQDGLKISLADPDNRGVMEGRELVNPDVAITAPQTAEEDARRLMVLRSYNILESEVESGFEDIIRQAKRIFNVSIAIVTLVDGSRAMQKCTSFCAHVVQRTSGKGMSDILVVPDATKDSRFAEDPLVAGEPYIRCYAGAPLLTPEGEKVGTVCIIDFEPRPEGLSAHERNRLLQLSSEAVFNMIMLAD